MEKETQLKIFCLILLFLGVAHCLYTSRAANFMFPLASPIILAAALMPAQKIRETDYSHTVSFTGILFVISSYIIYFAFYFTDVQNKGFALIYGIVVFVYYLFLTWYKGL